MKTLHRIRANEGIFRTKIGDVDDVDVVQKFAFWSSNMVLVAIHHILFLLLMVFSGKDVFCIIFHSNV